MNKFDFLISAYLGLVSKSGISFLKLSKSETLFKVTLILFPVALLEAVIASAAALIASVAC
ncbi:hypothetical protein ACLSZC_04455 [Avibacterium avium]|uniref:hypothetical protein n=1 Tax=Avibacterium avium TaxID=751 RepID=UPI003BF91814